MPRPPRSNQSFNQPVTSDINTIASRRITFNYSENFNRIIELSAENFTEWKTNILYLLTINNLETYVVKERIKKIRIKDLHEDVDDYIKDQFDDTLVYDKDTSEEDIKNDILV